MFGFLQCMHFRSDTCRTGKQGKLRFNRNIPYEDGSLGCLIKTRQVTSVVVSVKPEWYQNGRPCEERINRVGVGCEPASPEQLSSALGTAFTRHPARGGTWVKQVHAEEGSGFDEAAASSAAFAPKDKRRKPDLARTKSFITAPLPPSNYTGRLQYPRNFSLLHSFHYMAVTAVQYGKVSNEVPQTLYFFQLHN